jgi:hypothetical protein
MGLMFTPDEIKNQLKEVIRVVKEEFPVEAPDIIKEIIRVEIKNSY